MKNSSRISIEGDIDIYYYMSHFRRLWKFLIKLRSATRLVAANLNNRLILPGGVKLYIVTLNPQTGYPFVN